MYGCSAAGSFMKNLIRRLFGRFYIITYSDVLMFWPPKTVPVFVDQWSGKEWHGNGIRMRTH